MRAIRSWLAGGRAVGAGLAVLGFLGGCSEGRSSMPEAASIELSDQVQEVREATTAGDVDRARAELAEIHTTVEALRSGGQISADDATRITAAADDVSQHLALVTTTTMATPATAPTPTTPSPRAPGPPDRESGQDDDDNDGDDEEDDGGDDKADAGGGRGPKEDNGRGRGRD